MGHILLNKDQFNFIHRYAAFYIYIYYYFLQSFFFFFHFILFNHAISLSLFGFAQKLLKQSGKICEPFWI